MIFRKRSDSEDAAIRRLLAAAAMEGEPAPLSPFFMKRLRAARLAAMESPAGHPIGAAAWQMLPALGLLVSLMTIWSGYSSYQSSR
jgi:hypothetical protein